MANAEHVPRLFEKLKDELNQHTVAIIREACGRTFEVTPNFNGQAQQERA